MNYSQVVLPGVWHGVAPVIYGSEDCAPGHSYGPAVRSYYLLHYVMEGEGIFICGDGAYRVEKGDLFVIRPGEVTTYRADTENPWTYVWIGIDSKEPLPFLHESVLRQKPVKHLFTHIWKDWEEGMDARLFSVTHELLWILSRNTQKGARPGSRYAEYLKLYIDNTYMDRISIHEIAVRLHIDRRYLTALFRERYGLSPQSYLIDYRLTKADAFLESGHSVTEAASMAGFTDLSNFSRRYKQKFGICPSRRR